MADVKEEAPNIEELEGSETVEVVDDKEIPEDEAPAVGGEPTRRERGASGAESPLGAEPDYIGQVTIRPYACIGTTAYVDVWVEIRPMTAWAKLAVGLFNSAGQAIGSTGWLGPYRPSSASARYIGRRLGLQVPVGKRSATAQGFAILAGSSTLYRSGRVPMVCPR